MIRIVTIIALLGFFACSPKKEVAVIDNHQEQINKQNEYIMALSAKVDSLEKVIEEQQRKSLLNDHDSLLFTLRRTPCLGTCPVFNLEVYTDGFVQYNGRNYVDLIGEYTGVLNPEQMKIVEGYFKKANFYSLRDEYSDSRVDIPSTEIEYFGKSGYKKVVARTEIPRNFRVLASELEGLIKEIDWTLTD